MIIVLRFCSDYLLYAISFVLKLISLPLSTHTMRQNLEYDVTSTSALQSFSCLYLMLLNLFDYNVALGGSLNVV